MDLTAGRVSEMLARDSERVCRELLPGGKRTGNDWCAGSVEGDEGKSLKVCLDGSKAGVWADFASGGDSGDLLDLWANCRGLDLGTAIREARAWLGIAEPDLRSPRREYSPPQVPKCVPAEGDALDWLKSRGLTEDTLRRFRVASSGSRVLFPFLDPLGERVMVKWRSITSKDTAPTSKDQRPSLFGWQAIPPKARHVAICEGEIDAMSLSQMGIPALSVPFGGGAGAKQQWVEHEYDNLARFDVIYLALDNDGPGREAAVEIAKRLGDRCRVVELPAKDANECLQQGLDVTDAFRRARTLDPEGLMPALALKDDVLALMFPDPNAPPDGIEMPWRKFDGRLSLRYGELVVCWGINGHGKTGFANQIALHAVRQGERVMIASLEYRPERFLRKLVGQAGGLIDNEPSQGYVTAILDWMGERVWLWGKSGSQRVEALIEVMGYAHRRYGVRVFVVDSLLKLGLAEDDYNGQKLAVEALVDFKNEHNCLVILVCHSRKQDSEAARIDKMDIRGSGAIGDLADTIIGVSRNKRKEAEAQRVQADPDAQPDQKLLDQPDTWINVGKQRNGRWEGTAGLWFAPSCEQFLASEDQQAFRYVLWPSGLEDRAA